MTFFTGISNLNSSARSCSTRANVQSHEVLTRVTRISLMAAQCETIGDDVASMDLFDEKGDVVKFGDLYGERKALVVFVRVSHVTKTSLRLVQLDCSTFCDTCAKNTSKVEARLHI